MKLTKTLSAIALVLLSCNALASETEKPEDSDQKVEAMQGMMGMNCMHGKGYGKEHGKNQCMHGKGHKMHGKGMHGKGMPGMMMPGMVPMSRGPGMSPDDMKARLMQHFDLSAEQMAKMEALMKDKSVIMQSLDQQQQDLNKKFEELDTGSASYKTDIFSLAEEQATLARRMTIEKGEMRFNLDSILSPEQRQRFAQMKARKSEMKQRMGQGMPPMGMPGMGMRPGMPQMGMPQMGMPQMAMPPKAMPQMAKPPKEMPQTEMPPMGAAPFAMPQIGKPPMSAPTLTAPEAPTAPSVEAPAATAPTTETPEAPATEAPAATATTETPAAETTPKSE